MSGHKPAESEFDELLGQLVDELAMTPATESSGLQLIPDPPPAAEVTPAGARPGADAAVITAADPPARDSNNVVKIVGILAASLTVVAIAAIAVFATDRAGAELESGEAVAAAPTDARVEPDTADALARAEQAAAARVQAEQLAQARAEQTARAVRIEAELLADELEAQKQAEQAQKSKRKRSSKRRSSSKKPPVQPKDSFEDL